MLRIERFLKWTTNMALKVEVIPHDLEFLFEAGTSRGVLRHKKIWILKLFDANKPGVFGLGEAGPLSGLSLDDLPDFEDRLKVAIDNAVKDESVPESLEEVRRLVKKIDEKFPSVRFGLETALLDLYNGGKRKIFENDFYDNQKPLQINGLIWMGNHQLMMERLNEKIEQGFRCIKVKIGAIDFEKEMELLEKARKRFSSSELELRVDANGAFGSEDIEDVLNRLNDLSIHSIEQPIKAGQVMQMRELCKKTPVPIALDEELIEYTTYARKYWILNLIRPQYIILKPSLLGGFGSTLEWIEIAEELGVNWWITSALESNIGLNAICQLASSLNVTMPQGLGTGKLYSNNFESPLTIVKDEILYDSSKPWAQVIK